MRGSVCVCRQGGVGGTVSHARGASHCAEGSTPPGTPAACMASSLPQYAQDWFSPPLSYPGPTVKKSKRFLICFLLKICGAAFTRLLSIYIEFNTVFWPLSRMRSAAQQPR